MINPMTYATVVSAVATIMTMTFIGMQWRIANKEQKLNLFKVRFEFYEQIVVFFSKAQDDYDKVKEENDENKIKSFREDYKIKFRWFCFSAECLFDKDFVKFLEHGKTMFDHVPLENTKKYVESFRKEGANIYQPTKEFESKLRKFLMFKKD
jgi:hypothetical protein